MRETRRDRSRRMLALVAGALLGSVLPAVAAPPATAIARLQDAAGTPLQISRSHGAGPAVFVAPRSGVIPVPDAGATAEARGLWFAAEFAAAFGAAEGSEFRAISGSRVDEVGQEHVRLQQVWRGVPVAGGELVVHLRGTGITAANGRTLGHLEGIDVSPSVAGSAAAASARDAIPARLLAPDVVASEPRLEIFNRHLLNGRPGSSRSRLAWFVEVRGRGVRQYVWIDAHTGELLLDFSQLTSAKDRRIHDSNNSSALPGALIRSEGGPATADPDANAAYTYSGHTYDYYFTQHGLDSFDNFGSPLISSVNHCQDDVCPYANAFWNGSQVVFGEGMALADDVDAHELTHAVIERSANLYYYMQSGALNESFADIFGETIDLTNAAGTDTSAVRWQLGEDLPPSIGVLRHMGDPTLFGDPGKMSDVGAFECSPYSDGGGVHSNSGIPNHAYALMVDGGTYNDRTVAGIGTTKAGKIQFRALSIYLTSGANFLDAYNALNQACADLVGTSGITASNCTQVQNALDAVEMANPVPCVDPSTLPIPERCEPGLVVEHIHLDDFDADFWWIAGNGGADAWGIAGGYATSGPAAMYGQTAPVVTDTTSTMESAVLLPADARLQFNHAFAFDNSVAQAYDGGVLEYTTNGGTTWIDAAPLMSAGALYNATIDDGFGNPLGGRPGFGFYTHGYTGTQLDLASLAGQSVKFRFRIGTDSSISDLGWLIDDFHVYKCVPPPATLSVSDTAVTEANTTVNATFTVTLSPAAAATVTVHWATASIGGATSGADYTASAGNLTFTPGQTSKTFTVAVLGDQSDEGTESFYVDLSAPTNAVITDGQARGQISDDDPAPVITISDPVNTEADAALTPATFTVTLTGQTERTVDVDFATGTAGTATPGVDYQPKSGGLRFQPGETRKTLVVRLMGDTVDEARETYFINLSGAANATLGDAQAMGTIVDNDPTPAGSPNLSIGNATVLEADTGTVTATFTLTLSAASGQPVSVTYATGTGGTATSGADYVGFALRTTIIPAGTTSRTITVTINNDNVNEANETFFVNLTSASNANIVDAQGQGTITNDDAP